MERLTEDMIRLHSEIAANHRARKSFKKEIRSFVKGINRMVGHMLSDFHKTQIEMAKQTRLERQAFMLGIKKGVHDIKQKVAGMRQEFAADIAGAHRAFFS